MAGPSELVNTSFALAQTYAATATTQMASFASALNDALYTPPTVNVSWTTLASPVLPPMPDAPAMPEISFSAPIGKPSDMSEVIGPLDMAVFTEVAPDLILPSPPSVYYGAAPTVPGVGVVAIPSAPMLEMPSKPTMLDIVSVPFSGVDLKEDWLDKLGDVPALTLAEPTPYTYVAGAEYASALLSSLKGTLNARMAGGTGLSAAVEDAIWSRAKSREVQVALASEREVSRSSEAQGFLLPTGVMAAQLREAQKSYYDKISGLSRDVAIKQAEMEQDNLKHTIDAGMKLEGILIDYSYKLEQLSFDASKMYAENAIQVYNAKLSHFNALLKGYEIYASTYKSIIEGQMAKVEVYKAQLQGEQTKADINRSLTEQYKAGIEAGMAQVKIYEAQIGAAKALVQIEEAKIGAAAEQIKAYIAQVNAETSKVEAYKAQVQGEVAKLGVYQTKASVYAAVEGVKAEHSRALIARYSAIASAKASEWDGYKAQVMAESARIEALGRQSTALLEGYRAETSAVQAQAELQTTAWQSHMKQYEASANITLQSAKINNDAAIQTNNARLDAAKAGTQVYAQLASSAYGMIHASAGITSGGTTSVNYSYKGDVSGTAPVLQFA